MLAEFFIKNRVTGQTTLHKVQCKNVGQVFSIANELARDYLYSEITAYWGAVTLSIARSVR